ncbi:ComEC/Rec2 family competence protein [Chelativorans sp. M5D2P16]|uniref:ComEC/Rec2 family competence protein n=1 Tax=Chelativorans sp. M5D2P16 TaxID=3095678 RepID=UPI002AC9FD9B|nr:ComEC/Rec2 family competence protein [Chelativorans sp. M5D2P16]MDZ5697755.1 ComEC/Rec2 family competence protein [Chelativorans sp. M5D2P16]
MGGESAETAQGERAHFRPAEAESSGGTFPLVDERRTELDPRPRIASIKQSLIQIKQLLAFYLSREFSRDAARGAGFLCLPVLLAGGAAVYFALPREPGTGTLVLTIAFLTLLTWQSRRKLLLSTPLAAVLVFTVGLGAAKLETLRASTPMVGSDVTTRITGRLVQQERRADGRIRLTIDILETERPHLSYPPDRVRLTARDVPADLRPGDGVYGLVRLMSPSGPVRPGAYDFSFTSYFAGRNAVGFFMSGPERVTLDTPAPLLSYPARWLERMRGALAERIRSQIGGPEGEIAVAVITGFRAGIPEEINEWLRRAGLAHILAISGLHMALVAATVMVMVRAVSALFPGFSSRVPVKKYAAAAALVMCTLYLCISGAAVAAQRSYVMLAVMLAALICDRAAITMRNVAIAALVIVAWSPHVVVGPSFQMSFAATAALVAGYAAWNHWRQQRATRRPPPEGSLPWRLARYGLIFLVGLSATSLIAGTATAIYGVWHFQRVTPLALPANLTAMPVVSVFAMPAAVLAILSMPFGLDGIFLKAMGQAIAAVVAIAEWFSTHSPVDAVGLIPLTAMLFFTGALLVLVVSTTWLRLLALPLAAAGVVFLAMRQLPHVVITEDATLVGLSGEGALLAVNRTRPNGFTMDDWTRALAAGTVVKPTNVETGAPQPQNAEKTRFHCGEDLCLARHESDALIAHAATPKAARAACAGADLVVLDDAVTSDPCGPAPAATVVTKRDLAHYGSAAIFFEENPSAEGSGKARITFAITKPWRPWHAHRAWSRAARGLPPHR